MLERSTSKLFLLLVVICAMGMGAATTLGSSELMPLAPSTGSVAHQNGGDEWSIGTLGTGTDGARDVRAIGSPLATPPASSHQAARWPVTGTATLHSVSPVVLTILLGFALIWVVRGRVESNTPVTPALCWKPAHRTALPPLCQYRRLSAAPSDGASGDAGTQSNPQSRPVQHVTLKVERYDRIPSTNNNMPMRMSRGPPSGTKKNQTTLSRSRVGARKALLVKSGDV